MDINQDARELAVEFIRSTVEATPVALSVPRHEGGSTDWHCTLDLTDPDQQPHALIELADKLVRVGVALRVLERDRRAPHLVRVIHPTMTETPA